MLEIEFLDKGDNSDESLSSYQSFGSHDDTLRLEYQTNDNKFNENKNSFNDRFDSKNIATETEGLNSNEFMRRKLNNNYNNHKNQNKSTIEKATTEGLDFQRELTIEAHPYDDLNDSKIDENLSSNKLNKEDLQNPDFEEAIASYVDENGGIHMNDGPGGLFGVVPPQTVSDHHIEVFSRPAIQDNRVSLLDNFHSG